VHPHVIASLASVGWPVLDRIRFGSFTISPHGLFIAIGFMIGAWVFGKLAARRGISIDAINSIVFWSLLGAIVGARVFYVIAHVSEFSSPLEWLYIWKGGISLLGGIAGATMANAVNIRRYGLRFFQVADSVVAPLAFGITIGRIGDLIIGDHLGRPTSWLLAWQYKGGTLAPPFGCIGERCTAQLQEGHVETISRQGARLLDDAGSLIVEGVGVHQTALYDMLLVAVLFVFLWWFTAKDRREGVATLAFAAWYGCNRLLEDSLRIDKRFGPLTGSQWTALTVVVISAAILVLWAVKRPIGPTTPSRRATTAPDDGVQAEGSVERPAAQ
jgi:phosphatidylglycerol---prolipoprotein diacylglyceryl transferase